MSRRTRDMIRATFTAVLLGLVLLACSEDDNPYWWRCGVRAPGDVLPDTVWFDAVRDTTVEIEFATGSSPYLLVGQLGGVEARAYLKFTSLPDSADEVLSAHLDLFIVEGFGDSIAVQIHEVLGESWTEEGIRWEGRPEVASAPLSISNARLGWTPGVDDTVVHRDVLQLAPELVERWIADSEQNYGVMLRLSEGETDRGVLRILSGDARVIQGDSLVVSPALTLAYVAQGVTDTTTLGPSQDAYVQGRISGQAWGSDSLWLGVGGGRPRRAFVGFDLKALQDSLARGPTFSIAHGSLLLRALPDPADELPYADSLRVRLFPISGDTTWSESRVPDSLKVSSSSVASGYLYAAGGVTEFTITTLVTDWVLERTENEGLAIIASDESTTLAGIRFGSRESGESRPRLRILVTHPPPPRPGENP